MKTTTAPKGFHCTDIPGLFYNPEANQYWPDIKAHGDKTKAWEQSDATKPLGLTEIL